MKEQLIKFETAKLAKEKGFDWDVLFGKDVNGMRIPYDIEGGYTNWNVDHSTISSPTQSLLQKWLREVHNVDITIKFDKSGGVNWYYYNYKIGNGQIDPNIEWDDNFKTYEEALEIGLQEALKLLKQ